MKSIFAYITLSVARNVEGLVTATNVSTQPRFRMEINRSMGVLELFENQEPADAVYNFARLHGLDVSQRGDILDNICLSLSCTRKQALLWSTAVDVDNEAHELFQLYEGEEAADAVHEFVSRHKLADEFRAAIMKKACAVVECKRLEPVIYTKTVNNEQGKQLGILTILKGVEPIDAIDQFVQSIGIEASDRNATRNQLFNLVCSSIECNRSKPLVYRKSVNDENGQNIGELEILEGEEVLDRVDTFLGTLNSNFDKAA
eukprot:CCRYP_012857-RA/>CCRYP_012857-RA protein AED:0.11 eAED:0.11 QI:321/1/0.5/1/1/0.5/2/0/258